MKWRNVCLLIESYKEYGIISFKLRNVFEKTLAKYYFVENQRHLTRTMTQPNLPNDTESMDLLNLKPVTKNDIFVSIFVVFSLLLMGNRVQPHEMLSLLLWNVEVSWQFPLL